MCVQATVFDCSTIVIKCVAFSVEKPTFASRQGRVLTGATCAVINEQHWGHEMRHAKRGVKLFAVAASLAASVALAGGAEAQANPISFGITAGATKAIGDFSDGVNLGYHAGALVQYNGPDLPVGIRADVVYHRFSVKDVNANTSITAGTVNLVYSFPMDAGAQITPYLIGGVGYYHASFSCSSCGTGETSSSDNKFGVNGGAGVTIPLSGFSTFIEARFHNVFTDSSSTRFIPVSVGIMFR